MEGANAKQKHNESDHPIPQRCADQDEADRLAALEARLADKICRHVTKEINSLVIEVEQKFEQA